MILFCSSVEHSLSGASGVQVMTRWGYPPHVRPGVDTGSLHRWSGHSKTKWQSVTVAIEQSTVAWACSQLVVTRSEPNDFFTLSRSLFIVIFKYLFLRCPVASLSCLIAFCIWSLVFSVQSPLLWVESAHLGFSRQPRCHTSKPLRLALVIMSWTPHKNVILACWAVAGEWNEATVNIPPDSLY